MRPSDTLRVNIFRSSGIQVFLTRMTEEENQFSQGDNSPVFWTQLHPDARLGVVAGWIKSSVHIAA